VSGEQLLEPVLASMSCKAAVKAGDELKEEEWLNEKEKERDEAVKEKQEKIQEQIRGRRVIEKPKISLDDL